MAKSREKLEAIRLRRRGESVKEIAKKLGVSASGVSVWTRDITLTRVQRERLTKRWIAAGHRGRMLGAEMNRKKKAAVLAVAAVEAKRKVSKLSERDLLLAGLGLYWGEGVKASGSQLAMINSDPRVIKLMMRWFTICWKVDRSRFHPRVFINGTHRDREKIIARYWAKELKLPNHQFGRMIFLNKPNKKVYENRNVYYGVLALRVAKGADVKYRILAAIDRMALLGTLPG